MIRLSVWPLAKKNKNLFEQRFNLVFTFFFLEMMSANSTIFDILVLTLMKYMQRKNNQTQRAIFYPKKINLSI